MYAVIEYKLCNVKLLGELNLDFNDELLTDLTTVFFGLGIFNANDSFRFYQNTNNWGHQSTGYLTSNEWSYSLALFTYSQGNMNPEWKVYLNKTIRKDMERCLSWIEKNEDELCKKAE